jgi:hypothetical protein
MLAALPFDLEGRLFGIFLGLLVGTIVTSIVARWRLAKARQSVLRGDAGDMVAIELHLVESVGASVIANGEGTPLRLRRRYLGQRALSEVIPNLHLSRELRKRASKVDERNTLISMEGATGTYLLETLCGFVCDRVCNGPFEHDVYVMAPCREPAKLAYHKPITVILIAQKDLEYFLDWPTVRAMQTEHASDGVRLITLMDLANRYKQERAAILAARAAGRSTRYMETMFLLDLALDKRAAPLPTQAVPWKRFVTALTERQLELQPSAPQGS